MTDILPIVEAASFALMQRRAWVTRTASDDPEAGGALTVAGVQLSIMAGAAVGGLVFDSLGSRAEFMASGAMLLVSALLTIASRHEP